MRSILGAPVFTYRSKEQIFDADSAKKAWNIFKNGEKKGYIMGAKSPEDAENPCELEKGQFFSVLAALKSKMSKCCF